MTGEFIQLLLKLKPVVKKELKRGVRRAGTLLKTGLGRRRAGVAGWATVEDVKGVSQAAGSAGNVDFRDPRWFFVVRKGKNNAKLA